MTERSESERAELVALADRLELEGHFEIYRGDNGDNRTSAEIWLREDERDLIVTALRRLAALDQKPVAWHPSNNVPNVGRGSSNQYILAVYRKRSGKVYSFAAEYLNAYPLRYEYGCPKGKSGFCDECSEDGCLTTGWHIVEGADDDGYTYHSLTLDDGDEIKGWRDVPQWGEALSPPPAAGWDDKPAREVQWLVSSARAFLRHFNPCNLAEDKSQQWQSLSHQCDVVDRALRHNAPPDSGAGKSDDAGARISNLAADLVVSGWMASNAQDVERHKKEAEQKLLDFACDEVERHIKRDPSVMPDHGGADAGVGLYTVQEVETALKGALAKLGFKESALVAANASAELQNDLGEMLRALGMPDAAQPRSPHEVFQSAIAEMKRQLTNASAEARLREALEPFAALVPSAFDHSYPDDAEIVLVCNGEPHAYLKNINFRRAAAALSSHPHASDCDKQGER